MHSDSSLSDDEIEGIEGESDFDSNEASDGESDFDFSDAESDCGIVHANVVCTKQIPQLPKSVK